MEKNFSPAIHLWYTALGQPYKILRGLSLAQEFYKHSALTLVYDLGDSLTVWAPLFVHDRIIGEPLVPWIRRWRLQMHDTSQSLNDPRGANISAMARPDLELIQQVEGDLIWFPSADSSTFFLACRGIRPFGCTDRKARSLICKKKEGMTLDYENCERKSVVSRYRRGFNDAALAELLLQRALGIFHCGKASR